MNKLRTQLFDESRILRVTFHPDYTYAQFVGSLRPYTDVITGKSGYRYTPGPFCRPPMCRPCSLRIP